MTKYYNRSWGLDWLHDEAANGSSRQHHPVTKAPAASIESGTVVALRTADGGVVPLDPTATDGSQTAAGITINGFKGYGPGDTDLRRYPIHTPLLTNRADVIGGRLIWPTGITAEQKAVAVTQLAALGIAVV